MKRLSIIFLVILMVFSLAACASTQKTAEPQDSKEPQKNEDAQSSNEISWPTKPIQIVVGANPGGDSDFNARAIAEFLSGELGQPAVVVNVPGSGTALGAQQVHDAQPDGYTVLLGHSGLIVNKLNGLLNFALDGFEPIASVSENAGDVFLVSKNSGWETLNDLVNAAKEKPGTISLAADVGSTTHIVAAMFEDVSGADFNIVAGGDGASKVASLLGGQIDSTILAYGTAKPYIESGDFIPLAVAKEERNEKFPEIPTALEQGYDVYFQVKYYLAMPKGTPKEITDKFGIAIKNITEKEEYAKMIDEAFGQVPVYLDSEELVKSFENTEKMIEKYVVKN